MKTKNKKIIFGIILFLAILSSVYSATNLLTPITNCTAEDNAVSAGLWANACDNIYPGTALFNDDSTYETHTTTKAASSQYWAGIRINSTNATITNCSAVTNVMFCYKHWTSNSAITNCDVSVDANSGASYTSINSMCPPSSESAGIICTNITSSESWSCGNFFGASATGALAKSEVRHNQPSGAPQIYTITWDAFYFNVTYTETAADTTKPAVQFVAPTETSGQTFSRTFIQINATATDAGGLKNITIRLYNSTNALINSTNILTSPNFINYTGLAEGLYYFNATACDNANNCNSTEKRNITLALPPAVTLVEPADSTEFSFSSINLTYNVSSINNIANCSLYLNNLLNQTDTSITKNTNQTFALDSIATGNYSWHVNCTDSSGLTGTSQARIIVIDLNSTTINTTIDDANNTPLNTTITIFDENGTLEYNETSTEHTLKIPKGKYKIQIKPTNSKIKDLTINGLDTTNETLLSSLINIDQNPANVTEIPTALLFDREVNITNTYAVYPNPDLIFENATITTTAIGTELYKCANWNFTERICMGTWDLVKSLTSGQNYTITINSTDPGFVEVNATVNTAANYTEIVTKHYNVSIVTDANSGLYGLPAKCIAKDYSNTTFLNTNLTCVSIGSYSGTTGYTLGYDRSNPTTSTNENGPFRVKVTSTIRSDKIQTWYAYDNYLVGRTQFIAYAGTANDGFIQYFYVNDTNTIIGQDSFMMRYAFGPLLASPTDTSTAPTTGSYNTFDTNLTTYQWATWYSNMSTGLLLGQVVKKRIQNLAGSPTYTHFTYDTEIQGSDMVAYENEYRSTADSYTNFDIVPGVYYFGAGTSNATVKNMYLYFTNLAATVCIANCSSASFLEKEFIYEINASNENSTVFNITGNSNWGNANETVYFLIRGLVNGTYVFNSSSNAVSWKNWSVFMNKTQLQRNADNTTIFAAVIGKTETVFFKIEKDLTAPEWSNNLTNPATPATYNSSQIYYFNVTWLDNVAVDAVKIEHNFTGTLANYTVNVTNSATGLYSYNITGLNASGYIWRMYANDTEGNLNYTSYLDYTVNKADSNLVIGVNQTVYQQGRSLNYTIYIPFEARHTASSGSVITGSTCYVTNNETLDNITLVYNSTTGNYTGQVNNYMMFDSVLFNATCSNNNYNPLSNITTADVWFFAYLWGWTNTSYGSSGVYETNWLRKEVAAGTPLVFSKTIDTVIGDANLVAEFPFCGSGTNCSFLKDYNMIGLKTLRLNMSINDTSCKPSLRLAMKDWDLIDLGESCPPEVSIPANQAVIVETNLTACNATIAQNTYFFMRLYLNCTSAVQENVNIYYNYTDQPANIVIPHAEPTQILTTILSKTQLENNYLIGPNGAANVTRETVILFNNTASSSKYTYYAYLAAILPHYQNTTIPNTLYVYNSTGQLWASDNASAGAPNIAASTLDNKISWTTETIQNGTTATETMRRKILNAIRDNETLVTNETNQKQWNITVYTIFSEGSHINNITAWTNYSAYGVEDIWEFKVNMTYNGITTDITSQVAINTTTDTITMPLVNLSSVEYVVFAETCEPPQISLIAPENNSEIPSQNGNNVSFNFTVIDDDDVIINCSIYLDDVLNQTNASTLNNTLTTFVIPGILPGLHSWKVNCSCGDADAVSNVSETRYFTMLSYCGGSYGGEADWIISSPTICSDETIPLKGNLTINPGASLVFNNITLLVNSTATGQRRIEANDNFTINHSIIRSPDINNYFFRVEAGEFKVIDSEISQVGNTSISNSTDSKVTGIHGCNETGLSIKTDYVLINNSRVYNNFNGICFQDSTGNIIQNSNITDNWGDGIYFWNSTDSVVENIYSYNNLWHVEIDELSDNITVQHSTFSGNGDDQDAIDIWCSNNLVYNNTIYGFTVVGIYIDGFYVGEVTGNNISSNNISNNVVPMNGVSEGAIEISHASNNLIENNIMVDNDGSGLLPFLGAVNNTFRNNTIINTNAWSGILLETNCSDNLFIDNYVENATEGAYFNESSNNKFIGNRFINSQNEGIYAEEYSVGNEFIDSEITGSGSFDVAVYTDSDVTLLNTTFDSQNTDIGGADDASALYVKWYLDVYANYTNGTLAENANVSAYDINGDLAFNELTDALGFIPRQNITEYYQNFTDFYYLTNYTLNATKDSYKSLDTQLNLTTNYLDGEFFITLDIELPVINAANATPQAVNPGDAINITANVTDDTAVSEVMVDINNDGNVSMGYFEGDIYYYDLFDTNISPGVYTFVVYANDSLNNWAVPFENNFTINAVCGISTQGSLIFGNVNVGTESGESVINVSNTGNALSNLTVKGTNWIGPSTISVAKTAFSTASGNFASKTLLQLTDQFVQQLNAWSTFPLYFQFKPDFGTNAGDYSQNITITTTC